MGKYFFGLHSGHLTAKAQKIAERHGADHSCSAGWLNK